MQVSNIRLSFAPRIVYNLTTMKRELSNSRKLQESFLKEAGSGLRMLKEIMDNLPMVAFYIKDREGRIVALNPCNCEICNVPDESYALGKKSSDLFPMALATKFMDRDRQVMQTGKPILGEINIQTSDRSTNPRRINTFPVFGKGNRIIGTASVNYVLPSDGSLPKPYEVQLGPALRYIEKNFASHISIPALAHMVNMSETHFRRCFRGTFGCTPSEYIITLRINAARDLLVNSNRTIADIAQDVGFNDHAHFIHAFRAQRKMTPGEYRRQQSQHHVRSV